MKLTSNLPSQAVLAQIKSYRSKVLQMYIALTQKENRFVVMFIIFSLIERLQSIGPLPL